MNQTTVVFESASVTLQPLSGSWHYLYGIIPTTNDLIFEVAGVDDHDDEVYTVSYNGLAAVVSRTTRTDYRRMTRQDAVCYLLTHQRVVEAVMRACPILPVKFGTVLPDVVRVRRLLARGERLFRATLERFAGQMQIEVVVLWNLEEVFQEIGQEEPIVRLKAQVTVRPPEETVADRVNLGRMVQASLEQRRAALRDRLLLSLREVALDLVVNPPMDDSMVANVALLVDEAGREALDRRLAGLDEEFGGRLHFRCVGPLPPYSFATVEVQMPSLEEVDAARRQLGLGEACVVDGIKQAYRHLAGRLHPDHNPEDLEAKSRMVALTQAYRLLMTYAAGEQGSRGAGGQGSLCSFSREAVERTLLIAIRRQEVPAQGTGVA